MYNDIFSCQGSCPPLIDRLTFDSVGGCLELVTCGHLVDVRRNCDHFIAVGTQSFDWVIAVGMLFLKNYPIICQNAPLSGRTKVVK